MNDEHKDVDMAGAETHEEASKGIILPFAEPIDTKYTFLAWPSGMEGEVEPFVEDEALIFRAKDNALLPTLAFYRAECERIGASKEQLHGIDLLIMRVEKWREQNPDRCKVPD